MASVDGPLQFVAVNSDLFFGLSCPLALKPTPSPAPRDIITINPTTSSMASQAPFLLNFPILIPHRFSPADFSSSSRSHALLSAYSPVNPAAPGSGVEESLLAVDIERLFILGVGGIEGVP